jgi:hypothetical protein
MINTQKKFTEICSLKKRIRILRKTVYWKQIENARNKCKIKKKDFYIFEGKKCIYEKIIFKNISYPKVTLKKWKIFYLRSL